MSVTIKFRSLINFDPMFPGATYCLYLTVVDIRTRYTVELFPFVISGLWPLVNMFSVLAVTLRKTAEDSKHPMIIQDCARLKLNQNFFLQKYLIACDIMICTLRKLWGHFFSLKREHFSV